MSNQRIHVFGASGSGTTTLGKYLANRIDAKHLDTDDFYWDQSNIPFEKKRPIEERVTLLDEKLKERDTWVLSGSLCSWGDSFIEHFTHVVFLWVPWKIREQRLRDRERLRFGDDALKPGGSMHLTHAAFLDWASKYDSAGLEQRSLHTHQAWMRMLPSRIRVIRILDLYPIDELTQIVRNELGV